MTVLSPFVYWAQNEENLYLKIDLKDVKEPDISLEDRKITFQATGLGARGVHKYGFCLDFNAEVIPEASNYKVLDNKVDFTIQKAEKAWWTRLTSQPSKPVWLKIDFDKWQSEDDLNDDEDDVRDVREDYPGVYKKLQQEEKGYSKDWKKVYLGFYNFFMYLGFSYVLIVMAIRYLRDGMESAPGTYEAVGHVMVSLQLFQFLEVMHPIFGYTRTNVFTAIMQVFGRFIVLIVVVESEPRLQAIPAIFYLFLAWGAIEIIRYSYYISIIYKNEIGLLTWLRYTMWIPLYPIGFVCEGVVLLRSIPYYEETGQFSLYLPNKFNFLVSFPMLLRIYLLIGFLPALYTMMMHMYTMRVKKLGPKKWQKSKKTK